MPLSNFGADFCAGGGATEKNIPMRFVGAQDVTAYRMSTYIVAVADGRMLGGVEAHRRHAGEPDSERRRRRAGARRRSTSGRHPFDVVLVLDKSGSMNDLPPGAISGAKKIDDPQVGRAPLRRRSGSRWISRRRDGAEWSHDRMGIVFFDGTAVAQTLAGADPPANFFVQRGAANRRGTR